MKLPTTYMASNLGDGDDGPWWLWALVIAFIMLPTLLVILFAPGALPSVSPSR